MHWNLNKLILEDSIEIRNMRNVMYTVTMLNGSMLYSLGSETVKLIPQILIW